MPSTHQIYSNVNRTSLSQDGTMTSRLHAGVHVVILRATDGRLMRAINYMTWQLATADQLAKEIRDINKGRIVILIGAVS